MTTFKARRMNSVVALLLLIAMTAGCASQRQATRPARSEEPVSKSRKTVYFDFDKTTVRSQDRLALNDVAAWLRGDKKSLAIVEGHADQIGDNRYNDVLSENRARAVRVYLRDQGADPRRMTVISKGEREPVAKGRGRAALQPNRRVEVYMSLTGR